MIFKVGISPLLLVLGECFRVQIGLVEKIKGGAAQLR
jgi:hypothetical protein